ncbi:hypothetical protein KAH27_05690 [bacterium]|nr:hypothetical protein [bacterium]
MEKKQRTIDILKETRKAPKAAIENGKKYNKIRKAILNVLKEGKKTIPQIAQESQMSTQQALYYTMTLMKFGKIQVNGIDDLDEYYYYEIKKD